eukprot:6199002-Pleurochrysis_carterae.AAC.1
MLGTRPLSELQQVEVRIHWETSRFACTERTRDILRAQTHTASLECGPIVYARSVRVAGQCAIAQLGYQELVKYIVLPRTRGKST